MTKIWNLEIDKERTDVNRVFVNDKHGEYSVKLVLAAGRCVSVEADFGSPSKAQLAEAEAFASVHGWI